MYFVPFSLQILEQNFLKENVNWDFLKHKFLETGGLKEIKIARADNRAPGSPELIWKALLPKSDYDPLDWRLEW